MNVSPWGHCGQTGRQQEARRNGREEKTTTSLGEIHRDDQLTLDQLYIHHTTVHPLRSTHPPPFTGCEFTHTKFASHEWNFINTGASIIIPLKPCFSDTHWSEAQLPVNAPTHNSLVRRLPTSAKFPHVTPILHPGMRTLQLYILIFLSLLWMNPSYRTLRTRP